MPARSELDAYRTRYRTAIEREGRAGEEARTNLRAFDPMEYAKTAAQGQYDYLKRDALRDIDDLRGQQVGTGRLRTGFGYGDQDRLWEGFLDRVGQGVAMNAMQAGGQKLSALTTDYSSLDRYGDWLAAGYDVEMDRYNEEQRKKSGLWGTLGTIAGGALGFIPGVGAAFGGPLGGAAIGGSIARSLA